MADEKEPQELPDENLPDDEQTSELVSYLDGELPPDQAEALEAEIGRNQNLRREADTLKRAWDLLDFLPRREPSPNFTERTVSQIAPLQQLPATGSSLSRAPVVNQGSGGELNRLPPTSPPKKVSSIVWLTAMIVCLGLGWIVQRPIQRGIAPLDDRHTDAQLLSELRLLKNLKYYRQIDDFAFLQALDQPELFAEDPLTRD